MKILVLATGAQPHLIKAIEAAGHTYEIHDPRALYLYVSESENGYDRLYNGLATLDKPVRINAKDFYAVISRIGTGLEYGANILTHLNENLGIYTTQTGAGLLTASNKLRTTMKLSSHGIRVPRTVGAYSPLHGAFLVDKVGGLPAVAKTLTGSQGRGVIILKDAEQTNTTLEAFWRAETPLKLQQYIEGGKTDIRAIVVGGRVVSAMERTGVKDFRANLSQGGSGRKVTLTAEQEQMCVRASEALSLSFSGVDLMIDQDGKAYVIEVNGNPGSGIIKITGHNHFIDLVKHVETMVLKAKPEAKSPVKTAIKAVQAGVMSALNGLSATTNTTTNKTTNTMTNTNTIKPEDDPNYIYQSMSELESLTDDPLTRYEAMAFVKLNASFTPSQRIDFRSLDSEVMDVFIAAVRNFFDFGLSSNTDHFPNLQKWGPDTYLFGFKGQRDTGIISQIRY